MQNKNRYKKITKGTENMISEYMFANTCMYTPDIASIMNAYYNQFKKRLTSQKYQELLEMKRR